MNSWTSPTSYIIQFACMITSACHMTICFSYDNVTSQRNHCRCGCRDTENAFMLISGWQFFFFLATTSLKSCLKNSGPPATWCSPDIHWCAQSLATPFLKLISLTRCYILCLWRLLKSSKKHHVCETSVCWWSVSRQPLSLLEAREIEIVIANKSSS